MKLFTRPQFIEIPSFCLSPVAPVRFNLSDPAKSTKWNFAVNVSNSVVTVGSWFSGDSPSDGSYTKHIKYQN